MQDHPLFLDLFDGLLQGLEGSQPVPNKILGFILDLTA